MACCVWCESTISGEDVCDHCRPPSPAEIPLYHILNARITFNNLNGCDDTLGLCADSDAGVEEDEDRDTLGTNLPSPGSDSSSVSSSTSENVLYMAALICREQRFESG